MSRRARVWIATAVVLLLTAASATYLGVTRTYALEYGSWFSAGAGAVFAEDGSTATYPLRPGKRVDVAISVRNPGPLPITLDGVSIETLDLAVEDVSVIANAASNRNCCLPQHAEPFRAVEIKAGDEAMVWLTLRQTGASPYAPCSGFTVQTVEVTYRVLGMPRSQLIALRTGLSFAAPCESTT
ncbi:MAG: hypothetical protein IRY85_13035 [Micromonosporaceae bacterium]|nr:hypothetical protein [Micromonosporaceae bacterium]